MGGISELQGKIDLQLSIKGKGLAQGVIKSALSQASGKRIELSVTCLLSEAGTLTLALLQLHNSPMRL